MTGRVTEISSPILNSCRDNHIFNQRLRNDGRTDRQTDKGSSFTTKKTIVNLEQDNSIVKILGHHATFTGFTSREGGDNGLFIIIVP